MKTTLSLLAGAALAVLVPAWLLAVPVSAQQAPTQDSGGPRGGGGAAAAAPAASAAPSAPSGGSSSGGSGGATGGSGSSGGGYGVSRGGGDRSGSGARATGGSGSSGAGYGGGGYGARGVGGRDGGGRATPRDGGATTGTGSGTGGGTGDSAPPYARPIDGHTPVGTAVPRGTVPTVPPGGGGIYYPGYYPGYGYGYYDPWGYGYGGYGDYGGFYDPWYGGYATSPQSSYTSNDEGSLKLKIKPRAAEVYVDGYFVGIVDDFDGVFQRLHIDSGAHRIEVRANGYETLEFEVRITPEHTTTYTGELKKIQ